MSIDLGANGGFRRVGGAHEISPGDMRAYDVAGRRVLVANVDGLFYAVDDTCTHAAASLADGDLDRYDVTCALHGSTFDVRTGAVVTAPAKKALTSYPARVEAGEILVQLKEHGW